MKLPKMGAKKEKEEKEDEKKKEKKERKQKEPEKSEGSRWSSVILLIVVVLVSGAVWVYGSLNQTDDGAIADEPVVKQNLGIKPSADDVQNVEIEGERPVKTESIKPQFDSSNVEFEENPGF